MKIYWMQPGEIDSISGGYIYNKNIIEGFRARSVDVELLIPGTDFPFPSEKSIETCSTLFQKMESSSVVVVDSLILGTIPDLVRDFSEKLKIAGIIHLPLSLNPDFTEEKKIEIRKAELTCFKHSKLLIVTSEYSKLELVKMGIDESKIQVLTPGIKVTSNERNYPENPLNLLCVSRISKSKGQLDLITALANLQHLNWKLTFCGGFDSEDNYFEAIMKSISDSGSGDRITFTGEISQLELEKFYRQADLLILPSYFETYSMVLQEAMAYKIPIISASAGATKQTANPGVALFYQPGNLIQLEEYLLSVFTSNDEYKKLVNGYSELDLSFATWKQKTEQFLQILKSE